MQPSHPSSGGAKRVHNGAKQRILVLGCVLVLALALTVFFVRSMNRPHLGNLGAADPANAALVAAGQRVYAIQCAGCHGVKGEGQAGWPQRRANSVLPAPPLDATGPAPQRTDQWLFATIKQGGQATAPPGYTSTMPAFGRLSDAEIWAVISFIKSTWPPDVQHAQPRS